jgi:hypothetical protein
MGMKVFIGALVVLGLLFVLGVGAGAFGGGNGEIDTDVGWIQGIGGLLPAPTLTWDDLGLQSPAAQCQRTQNNRLAMSEGQTCVYHIAATDDRVRTLSLRVVQGAEVAFQLTQPGAVGGTRTRSDNEDNQDIDINVYAGNEGEFARLTITCRTATNNTCMLERQE